MHMYTHTHTHTHEFYVIALSLFQHISERISLCQLDSNKFNISNVEQCFLLSYLFNRSNHEIIWKLKINCSPVAVRVSYKENYMKEYLVW